MLTCILSSCLFNSKSKEIAKIFNSLASRYFHLIHALRSPKVALIGLKSGE